MTLAVATAVLPQRRLAARPFTLEWELGEADGTPGGAPEDVPDVTGVTITAQLRVDRGVTPPAATTWTLSSGVSLVPTTIDDVVWTVLTLFEPDGLPAGTYDIIVSFLRTGGDDFVLEDVLELTTQP